VKECPLFPGGGGGVFEDRGGVKRAARGRGWSGENPRTAAEGKITDIIVPNLPGRIELVLSSSLGFGGWGSSRFGSKVTGGVAFYHTMCRIRYTLSDIRHHSSRHYKFFL